MKFFGRAISIEHQKNEHIKLEYVNSISKSKKRNTETLKPKKVTGLSLKLY